MSRNRYQRYQRSIDTFDTSQSPVFRYRVLTRIPIPVGGTCVPRNRLWQAWRAERDDLPLDVSVGPHVWLEQAMRGQR
jgi:hypothetical protein